MSSLSHLPTLARQLRELRPLEDVTVHEGGSATFQLELSQEGVTGEWAQGGVRLHPGPKCHIQSEGRTHRLVLSGLGLADSGCVSFTADTLRCAARLTVRGVASGPLPAKSLCVTPGLTMLPLLTTLPEWGIAGPFGSVWAPVTALLEYSLSLSPASGATFNSPMSAWSLSFAYLGMSPLTILIMTQWLSWLPTWAPCNSSTDEPSE